MLRNCSRCGTDYETAESASHTHVCPSCRKPRVSFRQNFSGPLTRRELQIARAVAEDKPNKIIAWELHLSTGTIKEYMHRIFRKLGVNTRAGLAAWEVRRQYTEL